MGQEKTAYKLEHYISLLERKPRSLGGHKMNELYRQLISMYAKQLRLPVFNQYEEVIPQLDGSKSFDDFLWYR
jgi:hypothetical protein